MKLIDFFKDWRISLMVALLIASIIVIQPRFNTDGALVTGVSSPASDFLAKDVIITKINNVLINDSSDFNLAVSSLTVNDSVEITYKEKGLFKSEQTTYPFLPILKENRIYIGISVSDLSFSNIEFGIDLVGGSKITLSPGQAVTAEDLENVKMILENRLNVYGFKEVPINILSDLTGNSYIKIEFPSSISIDDVEKLLESQGVFEARVGNKTAFLREDITSICMVNSKDCPSTVVASQEGFKFTFGLQISQLGAEKFANITRDLQKNGIGSTCYLNETIVFYLDNEVLDEKGLSIGCSMAGTIIRNPVISGYGTTRDEAILRMKELKSMIQSDKLPVKMNIENIEVISPKLGTEFLSNIVMVFLLAILCVDIVIAIRYKSFKIVLPIIFVTLTEIILTLGAATLMKWTFDISAIAGLIASVGTGVDDQIIITDEVLVNKEENANLNMKQKMKSAFFIVIAAFITSIAVMIPLNFAGAGVLKGFASTNIIAITIGVLITRPAYSKILELLIKNKA
jgi:preprotein translocase subunit SecD